MEADVSPRHAKAAIGHHGMWLRPAYCLSTPRGPTDQHPPGGPANHLMRFRVVRMRVPAPLGKGFDFRSGYAPREAVRSLWLGAVDDDAR